MLTGDFKNQAAAEQLFCYAKGPQKPVKNQAAAVQEQTASVQKTEGCLQVEMVDVTAISIHPEEIDAPKFLSVFGYKIDLASKIESLKESYVKNYTLTKSHNLMVARFAEFKTAALGALLSILGAAQDEIEKMQKKAVRDAAKQNKILFEENEYNGELLSIIGGSKKQIRTQNRVLSEIRNQLLIQAQNLGLEGHYPREMILEIRLQQCYKILEKFLEEKNHLEYQYQMVAVGLN